MAQLGRTLLVVAGCLAVVGGLLVLGERFGLGRLPGDIVWRKKNVTVYVPLVTSVVMSIILTVLANLILRRK